MFDHDPNKRRAVFDVARATFYLVAAVICVHLFVVVVSSLACIYASIEMISGAVKQCEDTRPFLMEVLAAALAAALAYSGGRSVPRE
jgi:hypothetical protein